MFLMRITAKSAQSRRKIETVVRKLSTLEAQKRIYFMRGKSMDSKNDRHGPGAAGRRQANSTDATKSLQSSRLAGGKLRSLNLG